MIHHSLPRRQIKLQGKVSNLENQIEGMAKANAEKMAVLETALKVNLCESPMNLPSFVPPPRTVSGPPLAHLVG